MLGRDPLQNALSKFGRDNACIFNLFKEITGKEVHFKGLDIALYASNKNVCKLASLLDTPNIGHFYYKDDIDVLLCIPEKCEDILDEMIETGGYVHESAGHYFITMSNDYPDVCLVVLDFDCVRIKLGDFDFSFKYDIIDYLDNILDLFFSDDCKILEFLEFINKYSCYGLYTFKTIDEFLIKLKSDKAEYGQDNEDYLSEIDKIIGLDLSEEQYLRALLIHMYSHNWGMCYKSAYDELYKWSRLISDDNCNFITITNYQVSVNKYKDLPKLLIANPKVMFDGLEIRGYISKDKSSIRKPYKINEVKNGYGMNDVYYCDGNLSRERAIAKFMGALKEIGGSLLDYHVDMNMYDLYPSSFSDFGKPFDLSSPFGFGNSLFDSGNPFGSSKRLPLFPLRLGNTSGHFKQ